MIFFWNYLCCLWLDSEELDVLPEKPTVCDSVDPFIVCSFEVLNSSLVDYQDLSQGWDWHGCSMVKLCPKKVRNFTVWDCIQLNMVERLHNRIWWISSAISSDFGMFQSITWMPLSFCLHGSDWADQCILLFLRILVLISSSFTWDVFKFDCVLPHLIGYGFTFFTLIFSGIFVVGHTDVWRWKQGKQQMRNWAVCTLRIMLNWWKQWAARAMVSIGAKHWQVVMIQSSSTTVPPSQPFWLLDQSLRLWSTLVFFYLLGIAFHIH